MLAFALVAFERISVRRKRLTLIDVRECALVSIAWPVLITALVVGICWAAAERLLGRLSAVPRDIRGNVGNTALSIGNISCDTSPQEQGVPLMVVIGGVGKVRLAAKAGLTPAYSSADEPSAGWEMTYIGEVEARYPQRWNGIERRNTTTPRTGATMLTS